MKRASTLGCSEKQVLPKCTKAAIKMYKSSHQEMFPKISVLELQRSYNAWYKI